MYLLSFKWVLPGQLAGCAKPGVWTSIERDMGLLQQLGIRLVVTLTETPLDPPPTAFGLRSLHFPIPDMGVPQPGEALRVCREIVHSISQGEPVAIHCKAGLGRTGTLLACTLVVLGSSAVEAVRAVRTVCPQYIQSDEQERFVGELAALDREERV